MSASAAYFSLARTQRCLSHTYAEWAREYAVNGDQKASSKHAAEARRLREDAKWHLQMARRFSSYIEGL